MKMEVLCGSKPGGRCTSNFTPAIRKILRKKTRCGQSFLRGSTKIARKTRKVQTTRKCSPLITHKMAERTASQARFMRKHPVRRQALRCCEAAAQGFRHPPSR